MTTDPPTAAARAVATERVEVRTLRERRRRVWRSLLLMVLIVPVLIVLTSMNRNEAAIDSCWKRMQAIQVAFQEAYDRRQPGPPLLPPPVSAGETGVRWRRLLHFDHNRFNVLFDPQRVFGHSEIGVGCCRQSHERILGHRGRHLLIFDVPSRRFEVRWMSETEFARRAEELGLRPLGER